MGKSLRAGAVLGAALQLTAVAAIAAPSSAAGPQVERQLTARTALETQVVREINALRRSHGLVPLRVNVKLRSAAGAHSKAMATRGFFAHNSADGAPFWKRVQRYYPRTRYWSVGENLLWSSPDLDARTALRLWLDSPPHRENLLTPRWREIGVSAVHVNPGPGVYQGLPVTIVTADFGVRR